MNITWEQVLPIYIDSLENGNEEQKQIAREELMRLAKAADDLNKKK